MSFFRWGSDAGVSVNDETALQVSAVMCAVRAIAEGCATPNIVLKEIGEKDGRRTLTAVHGHWAGKLISDRPNSFQTPFEFIEGMVFCAVLGHGALAIKNVVNGGREVKELLPVAPGKWAQKMDKNWRQYFEVTIDGEKLAYERDQVLFFRGPSMNGWRGLSAIEKARDAIGLAKVLERQQSKLAKSGGKPSGILSFTNALSDTRKQALKDNWESQMGANGDGGTVILDGEATYHQITMKSVDAEHMENRRMQIEEIARAFRIHPLMLMQADKASTFASAEQLFRNHVVHTLTPWHVRIQQALKRDILFDEPALIFDYDERSLMRGDFKDRADYISKGLGAGGQPGFLSVNEARALEGLNPIAEAWADEVPRGAYNPEKEMQDAL